MPKMCDLARSFINTEGKIKNIVEKLRVCHKTLRRMFKCAEKNELTPKELNAQVKEKRSKAVQARNAGIAKNRLAAKSSEYCKSLMVTYADSTLTQRAFRDATATGDVVFRRAMDAALAGEFGPELKLKVEKKRSKQPQVTQHELKSIAEIFPGAKMTPSAY